MSAKIIHCVGITRLDLDHVELLNKTDDVSGKCLRTVKLHKLSCNVIWRNVLKSTARPKMINEPVYLRIFRFIELVSQFFHFRYQIKSAFIDHSGSLILFDMILPGWTMKTVSCRATFRFLL